MSERNTDDLVLVQRAQRGDRSAFDALILRHENRAFQFAYRLTRNSDEASDVVAEAFVRVFNALPNFKGQSAFTTWLYRILTNCFLDGRKRDKHKNVSSIESALATEEGDLARQIEDPRRNPEEEAEHSARGRALEQSLRELPDIQRAMIVMFHAEGLSYEEISGALDLPLGTVKSRLNRARISLRELLSKHEELFPR